MDNLINPGEITCGLCRTVFERSADNKHCSNCFACTGCEIYYCPVCGNEIIITPVKKARER